MLSVAKGIEVFINTLYFHPCGPGDLEQHRYYEKFGTGKLIESIYYAVTLASLQEQCQRAIAQAHATASPKSFGMRSCP